MKKLAKTFKGKIPSLRSLHFFPICQDIMVWTHGAVEKHLSKKATIKVEVIIHD